METNLIKGIDYQMQVDINWHFSLQSGQDIYKEFDLEVIGPKKAKISEKVIKDDDVINTGE